MVDLAKLTRREVETLLIAKAQSSPEFRKLLIADPAKALAQEIGVAVPTGVRVEVLEETDKNFYIVLPPVGTNQTDPEPTGIVRLMAHVAGVMY